MSAYFSVLHESGEIRTRCAPCHTVEHVHADGELAAVAAQREPRPAQRLGYSGLIQLPDAHSADLLSIVYGLYGRIESSDTRTDAPSAEPLPVDCPASDYVSEFREIAVRLACRNLWKVQRQSAHVDADDLAQDAVVLMLDDPAKYATEPIEAGASQAVNDAVRNAQGGGARRQTRLSAIVGDEFPEPVRPEPLDYETEADALSALVGRGLAIHAALVANQVPVEVSADAVGVSPRTVARRRAEVSNRLYSLAFGGLAGSDR